MVRVVVVGGGLGGLASAARLAKLGHDVTLLERADSLGGALSTVTADDFTWDAGPTTTLLPAVIRDLFRKSGRPVERELALVPLDLIREHRFDDGSRLRLPSGSGAGQAAAVDAMAPGLGRPWADYVGSYAGTWELVRRDLLERPWHPDLADPALTALLASRQMLATRLRRTLPDPRLRLVASHSCVADGHDPRRVPAWHGVTAYVEQRFGIWTVPGGMAGLAGALGRRLATRGVTVHTGTEALDLAVRDGRVAAVTTHRGAVDADVVVCAIDPQRLPTLREHVRRTKPAEPPAVHHLGLEGDLPALSHEVVLHGDPLLVVRTGGTAPRGRQAWTVHARGRRTEDVLVTLLRRGLDLRGRVVSRIDRSPRDLLNASGGSPYGVRWQGRATMRRRLGPTTPVPGVYAAGAHATPGSGLPFVGLSASLVAQAIGPA